MNGNGTTALLNNTLHIAWPSFPVSFVPPTYGIDEGVKGVDQNCLWRLAIGHLISNKGVGP